MTKCYAYIRVSSTKQGEGASLEAQREAISGYADRNNLTISEWFEEKETAAKTGRPVFSRMMKELKKGKAGGLITHKIDRSSRNIWDWAMIHDLADLGLEIHFATESLDFNSRGGRLAADIQAVVAADYIRNLKEESLKGQRMRLQQGIYPYKAPIGYVDRGKGQLKTICPISGPLVVELFERYASGNYTFNSLAEAMNERGLRSFRGNLLAKSHVEKVIRNPFYIGKIHVRSTGMTYVGKHEALISRELFLAAQTVKSIRFGKKVTKHNHLFRGLFRCAFCDGSMIPERQKGTIYYRCHTRGCSTKSINEQSLHEAIENSLRCCRMDQEMRNAVSAALANVEKRLAADPVLRIGAREIEKLNARKATLADKVLDGVFDEDLFRQKQSEIDEEITTWRHRLTNAKHKTNLSQAVMAALGRLDEFSFTYRIARDDKKREMVRQLYSNRTVSGKNVYLEPQNWVKTVQDLATVSQGADLITGSRTEELLKLLALPDFETD